MSFVVFRVPTQFLDSVKRLRQACCSNTLNWVAAKELQVSYLFLR